MLAGECEPPLQKSTLRGNSRTEATRRDRLRLLGAEALLLALGQAREQRRDFLTQRLKTGRPAGFVPDDAAERERRVGRRRPIEGLCRPEIAGGAVGFARLIAHRRR